MFSDSDRLATLQALKNNLPSEINRCKSGRKLATLSRQLILVLAEIDELKCIAARPFDCDTNDP